MVLSGMWDKLGVSQKHHGKTVPANFYGITVARRVTYAYQSPVLYGA